MKTQPWAPMDDRRTWARSMPGGVSLVISDDRRYTGHYVYRVTDFWNFLIYDGSADTLVEAVEACCAVAHVYAAPIVRVGVGGR